MEKADRGWGADLAAEPALLEAGMERAAATGKYYTGRRVLATRRAKPVRQAPRRPEAGAQVPGNGPVYATGTIVDVATSGGYGHAVKKSPAFAYVKPELAATGAVLEISVLGQRRKAKVIAEPAYDAKNERLRK